jgi:hypothetical protein
MDKTRIKLNLGSGDRPLLGYFNLDAKTGHEIYPLQEAYACDGGVCLPVGWQADEIRASHVLEHFPHARIQDVVKNWVSRLTPGGVLKIAVPDFGRLARAYAEGKTNNYLGVIMGGQTDDRDYHKSLFDESSLRSLMTAAGLVDIRPWTSEIEDCASRADSLNLMGTKPEAHRVSKESDDATPVKILAVMSRPRLGFLDNMQCVIRELLPLGIPIETGSGVFWGQVLTRMMEKGLADYDYILTLDYDTFFTTSHVWRLCQLMVEHPGVDAICPLEVSRENDFSLFQRRDESGQVTPVSPAALFERDLMPIATGHFGLTLIRTEALRSLKKPWFVPIPDPQGSWHEGRQDEDIYFWNNFAACGFRLMMAPQVRIGHGQLMVSYPGRIEDNLKPVHCYVNDVMAGRIPEWCVPGLEVLR